MDDKVLISSVAPKSSPYFQLPRSGAFPAAGLVSSPRPLPSPAPPADEPPPPPSAARKPPPSACNKTSFSKNVLTSELVLYFCLSK